MPVLFLLCFGGHLYLIFLVNRFNFLGHPLVNSNEHAVYLHKNIQQHKKWLGIEWKK